MLYNYASIQRFMQTTLKFLLTTTSLRVQTSPSSSRFLTTSKRATSRPPFPQQTVRNVNTELFIILLQSFLYHHIQNNSGYIFAIHCRPYRLFSRHLLHHFRLDRHWMRQQQQRHQLHPERDVQFEDEFNCSSIILLRTVHPGVSSPTFFKKDNPIIEAEHSLNLICLFTLMLFI